MAERLEAGNKSSYISKRYIRVVEATTLYQNEDIRLIAIAAGALYKLPRTELIHKERLDEYMKHLYKVPGTNKQVVKKFVRIGEGSIIYGIGSKKKYMHCLFHLFCLCGTFLHFWMIYFYLI